MRTQFLGNTRSSDEDNILTFIHELFTPEFRPKNRHFFALSARKKGALTAGRPSRSVSALHVVVEEKLIRMRPQAQSIMFLALVRNPHLQEIPREHVAFEQKGVVG